MSTKTEEIEKPQGESRVVSSDLLAPFPMIRRHLMFIENAAHRGDMQQVRISIYEIREAVTKITKWSESVNEHLADDPDPGDGGSIDSFSLRVQYENLNLPSS